jgi:DHA1 family tetracycline resistance protein-like MFS transporter
MADTLQLPAEEYAPFNLKPLLFAHMACTMAVVSFISLVGPISRLLGLAPWQAGVAVTMGGILWMLMARAWGNVADRRGRRLVLLVGVGGVTLAYWSMCAVITVALQIVPAALWSFLAIVVTRGSMGAFFAAIPTGGQALIADHYPPASRAGSLAAMGAAGALGMVVGPAMAGALAQSSLLLPLYVTAVLPALAFLFLWFKLPRHERPKALGNAPLRLGDPRLRRPMAVCLTAVSAVGVAQMTVSFYALDHLHMTPMESARTASLCLTLVGIALIGAQLLVKRLGWTPERMIRVGGMISAVSFAGVIFSNNVAELGVCFFGSAIGMGWLFPAYATLAANSVEPHEQGGAAGSLGVTQGLGIVVGPLAGALLHGIGPIVPYALLAVCLTVTALWPTKAKPRGQMAV